MGGVGWVVGWAGCRAGGAGQQRSAGARAQITGTPRKWGGEGEREGEAGGKYVVSDKLPIQNR